MEADIFKLRQHRTDKLLTVEIAITLECELGLYHRLIKHYLYKQALSPLYKIGDADIVEAILYHDSICVVGRGEAVVVAVHVAADCSLIIRCHKKLQTVALR